MSRSGEDHYLFRYLLERELIGVKISIFYFVHLNIRTIKYPSDDNRGKFYGRLLVRTIDFI